MIGQLHVDDGHVELLAAEQPHGLGARLGLGDGVAGIDLEDGGEQAAHLGIVVDDEHVDHVRHLARS